MKRIPFPLVCLALLASTPGYSQSSSPAFWKFAPTPPMGWNSYDAFGDSVTEAEVLANANYMKAKLLPYGWNYVVVDFRWYDFVVTYDDRQLTRDRMGAALAADSAGRLLPAPERFSSAAGGLGFKPLADRIHAIGLKFGFHMMRGIPRQAVMAATPIEGSSFTAADAGDKNSGCSWCPDMFGVKKNEAGQAWYDSCARLWASWGLDFVKVDDISSPYQLDEIEMIRKAIDKCGRAIALSTSAGPTPPTKAAHVKANANMWRISGDFWDQWPKLNQQFDLLADWDGVGGPGHWPDADMIPFGHIGIRCWTNSHDRWTRFTHDEQVCLMTLWCIAPSPLMLGMNLPDNDEWTLGLITNQEALAINQDSLGAPASWVLKRHRGDEVWVRDLSGGCKALALFNRGNQPITMTVSLAEAGISGTYAARDIWQKKEMGIIGGSVSEAVPAHGAVFLKLIPTGK